MTTATRIVMPSGDVLGEYAETQLKKLFGLTPEEALSVSPVPAHSLVDLFRELHALGPEGIELRKQEVAHVRERDRESAERPVQGESGRDAGAAGDEGRGESPPDAGSVGEAEGAGATGATQPGPNAGAGGPESNPEHAGDTAPEPAAGPAGTGGGDASLADDADA
jgi:hypothetical protein